MAEMKKVGYFPSCMDLETNGHVFGAFSNGAGIYDRDIFRDVGRMVSSLVLPVSLFSLSRRAFTGHKCKEFSNGLYCLTFRAV